jgi:hypothetical protein
MGKLLFRFLEKGIVRRSEHIASSISVGRLRWRVDEYSQELCWNSVLWRVWKPCRYWNNVSRIAGELSQGRQTPAWNNELVARSSRQAV